MKNYLEHLTIESGVRFGKPIVKGTRISVYDILNWLANGMSIEEIKDDFPELTSESIFACLSYAAEKEHKISIAS
jgi:uncharacterized protein (DUF433 family)